MSNFTKWYLRHEIFRILLVFSQFLHLSPFKDVQKNAISFKLIWYKFFVHWKLKLLNFLMDSVLKLFVTWMTTYDTVPSLGDATKRPQRTCVLNTSTHRGADVLTPIIASSSLLFLFQKHFHCWFYLVLVKHHNFHKLLIKRNFQEFVF